MVSPNTEAKMQTLETKMERFAKVANDVQRCNNGVLPPNRLETVRRLKKELEDLKAKATTI